MRNKKQLGSRALIKELSDFLTTSTPNRECLVKLIKQHIGHREKSISLCFRGNYATMYYRCRQLLKLEYFSNNKQVKGFFNYKYANPNPCKDEYQNKLAALDVQFGNDKCNVWVILDGAGKVTSDNLEKILQAYIELIDFWLGVHRNRGISESDRQQQLFAIGFGNSQHTYFDIEYIEPRDVLIEAGYYDYVGDDLAAKKAEFKKKSGGRFDLLGLRKADGGYVLQFAEVKTKLGALDNGSGVTKHVNDYTKYCQYEQLVNKRKSDAVYTVNLLSKILGNSVCLTADDIIGHEIVFIFTDRSVKKVEQYREELEDNNIKISCYDKQLNIIE